MKTLSFDCLVAKQADDSTVLSFVATAEKISKIARISRVGRGENMELFGFQRSQIGNHIHENTIGKPQKNIGKWPFSSRPRRKKKQLKNGNAEKTRKNGPEKTVKKRSQRFFESKPQTKPTIPATNPEATHKSGGRPTKPAKNKQRADAPQARKGQSVLSGSFRCPFW